VKYISGARRMRTAGLGIRCAQAQRSNDIFGEVLAGVLDKAVALIMVTRREF
jgi:hypothetical protein